MIVTDHAPHSDEEKARPLENAPSGITGLETSLALGIKSLVEPGHISLMKLMELMSKNPAEFYRMIPGSITRSSSRFSYLWRKRTMDRKERRFCIKGI